ECRRMGIEVLPPDINQSFESFTAVTSGTEKNKIAKEKEVSKTIRFGLRAVKNIGEHIAKVIIEERKNNGLFKDLSDFLERICDKDLNKKSLESLIKCGGLDQFGERGQLLKNIENMLGFNRETSKIRSNGQTSLFGEIPSLNLNSKVKLDSAPPVQQKEKLAWEKELLGLYISEHPFSEFKGLINNNLVLPIAKIYEHLFDPQVLISGIVIKIQKIITRANESMLFVKIEDLSGIVEVLVFPSLLKETLNIWQEGKAVICQGKLSNKDQQIKLLCNKAVELIVDNAKEIIAKFVPSNKAVNYSKNKAIAINVNQINPVDKSEINHLQFDGNKLYVLIGDKLDSMILTKLKDIMLKYQGDKKVYFKIKSQILPDKFDLVETDFAVIYNQPLAKAINSLLSK
ncbi:MAG: OB-fold nucleic acid binding domain-containing protein, partial [Patescibacteria group bacterium]